MKQTIRFWIASGIALCSYAATSQTQVLPVPDVTLPANSIVTTVGNTSTITGGTRAGSNLFHSFREFSVPTKGVASFNNALSIQNIISRVTGGSVSNIDGLLKANGTANLFLINPYGIIFGPNASLSIGGSFVGSTAPAVNFADGTNFSATAHSTKPLLTVSVPIGLQFGGTSGSIQIQKSNLQVNTGKTLALLGGNVSMEGGKLSSVGGLVELGGLAGTGTVGLNFDTNGNLQNLGFPAQAQRADVSLSNEAKVDVAASGGGSIAINARNINIFEKSIINAGIIDNSGSVGTTGGNITLDATGTITLKQSSVIQTLVNKGATGSAGNINVVAGSLYFLSGSQLFTTTFGQGNAGSINVNASDIVSFDSAGNNASTSGIIASVAPDGVGKGGDINITTGSAAITNSAQLSTTTFGKGDAGNVNINARDQVTIDGANAGASGILTSVAFGAVGKGGNINITTGSLSVTRGAQLNALTLGQGNAGNVSLNARELINLDGENPKAVTAVLSSVADTGIGNAGEIKIDTGSLALTGGAELNTLTNGKGNAGNVSINARDRILLDGVNSKGAASGLFSSVGQTAVGNGGDIQITTRSLSVTGGAGLYNVTNNQGNAGNISINAHDTVSFDGVNSNGGSSGAYSSVTNGAVGKGGNIDITADSLSVTNGAILTASTEGQGNGGNITFKANTLEAVNRGQVLTTSRSSGKAGNITLKVLNSVTLSGSASGLFANTDANSIGDGGTIFIDPNQLTITNGAGVAVNSQGTGNGGSIQVQAGSISLDNGASLSARANSSEGGNINLKVSDLLQTRHKSEISATSGNFAGSGNGGSIDINTRFLVALPSENSDITANAFKGSGGRINIIDQGIFGIESRKQLTPLSDITASSQFGISGSVNINTLDFVPNQGLVELPSAPMVPELIQGCQARGGKPTSRFVNTGRGGLPPNPYEAQDSSEVWRDVQLPRKLAESTSVSRTSTPTITPGRIVEAQGWIVNKNGNVELVAKMPTPSSQERCTWR